MLREGWSWFVWFRDWGVGLLKTFQAYAHDGGRMAALRWKLSPVRFKFHPNLNVAELANRRLTQVMAAPFVADTLVV